MNNIFERNTYITHAFGIRSSMRYIYIRWCHLYIVYVCSRYTWLIVYIYIYLFVPYVFLYVLCDFEESMTTLIFAFYICCCLFALSHAYGSLIVLNAGNEYFQLVYIGHRHSRESASTYMSVLDCAWSIPSHNNIIYKNSYIQISFVFRQSGTRNKKIRSREDFCENLKFEI